MHKIEIPEANLKFYIPEDLSECNHKQYLNISKLLYQNSLGEISLEDLQTQAVYFLMNLKRSKKSNPKTDEIKYANVYCLARLLDSFFEETDQGEKVIKQYFVNNPIEKVRGAFVNYYGPSNEFNNVSFGEYIDGLSFFSDFAATGDFNFLYLLFATFYREKKAGFLPKKQFLNDKRIPYNSDRVQLLSKKAKRLDVGVIYGFFLLFTSFQKYLTTAKVYVQGQEIDLSLLYDSFPSDAQPMESNLPGLGMKSLLYTIAESGVFGTLEEVRKTSLWEILVRMYDIRKRDLDTLEQQKKQLDNAKG